jgi:hypothetical protein
MTRPALPVIAALLATIALPIAVAPPAAAQQTPARPAQGQPAPAAAAPVAQADIAWAKETLTQLGFNAGRADGAVTDLFRQRLREFQGRNGLTVNGQLDDPTVGKLMELRPRSATAGTLTMSNQPPPPEVRGGAAPAPPPAAPRAAPQAPVAAERSTATSSSLAVIARGGSSAPAAPPASATAPAPSAAPSVAAPSVAAAPQPAVQRTPSDPRTEARVDALLAPQPQAAPRATVEGGPSTAAAPPAAANAGLSVERLLGWTGIAGLGVFVAAFGGVWWTSGRRQPGRYAGLSAAGELAGRRAPSIGHPTSGLATAPRTGMTAFARR